MAVGDGGFSTQIQGFNKNEVNEYISNLRKKMNELEAEQKQNDSKVKAALKSAEDAEKKIQAIQKANADKIADLELQVKTERRNAEDLLDKIDVLKRKVKNGGGSADSGASAAEAQKQAAEIIAKANKAAKKTIDDANRTAAEVVSKAKRTASEMVASAQAAGAASGGGASAAGLSEFMTALKGYLDDIYSGYLKIRNQADEIGEDTGSASAVAVDLPDFSDIEAPSAAAPEEEFDFSPSEPEPMKELSFEDISSMNDDSVPSDDDMMGGFGSFDAPVSEIAENDTSDHSKPSFDMDFDKELISQTVPASSLKDAIGDDLFAQMKEEEEKFNVQPAEDKNDFSMDMDDGMDAMKRMLAEAEAAFGGGSGVSLEPEPDPEPIPAPSSASSPWEDLQKQLEAMEKTGNFGAPDDDDSPMNSPMMADDPQAPSADDSSIWDFGDTDMGSSSDDDDMSTDLFGSF